MTECQAAVPAGPDSCVPGFAQGRGDVTCLGFSFQPGLCFLPGRLRSTWVCSTLWSRVGPGGPAFHGRHRLSWLFLEIWEAYRAACRGPCLGRGLPCRLMVQTHFAFGGSALTPVLHVLRSPVSFSVASSPLCELLHCDLSAYVSLPLSQLIWAVSGSHGSSPVSLGSLSGAQRGVPLTDSPTAGRRSGLLHSPW